MDSLQFLFALDLTRHIQSDHLGYPQDPISLGTPKCEYCENIFTNHFVLRNHISSVHHKLRPFKCDLCNRTFGQKSHVWHHTNSKAHKRCIAAIVTSQWSGICLNPTSKKEHPETLKRRALVAQLVKASAHAFLPGSNPGGCWEPPLFYESLGRASILEIAFSKPMVEQ